MKLTSNIGRVAGFISKDLLGQELGGMNIFWKQLFLKNSLGEFSSSTVKFDLSELECGYPQRVVCQLIT